MNTNTGEIYRTPEQIRAAQERGEPLAEVSEKVAQMMEMARNDMNRQERRAYLR